MAKKEEFGHLGRKMNLTSARAGSEEKGVQGKSSFDVTVQSKEMSDGFPSDEPARGVKTCKEPRKWDPSKPCR